MKNLFMLFYLDKYIHVSLLSLIPIGGLLLIAFTKFSGVFNIHTEIHHCNDGMIRVKFIKRHHKLKVVLIVIGIIMILTGMAMMGLYISQTVG